MSTTEIINWIENKGLQAEYQNFKITMLDLINFESMKRCNPLMSLDQINESDASRAFYASFKMAELL